MIDFSKVLSMSIGGVPVKAVLDPQGNPIWNPTVDPSDEYFYVEDASGSDNTMMIGRTTDETPAVEVFCSTDKSVWTSLGVTSTTPATATVPANGKLYLKATASRLATDYANHNYIDCTGNFNVGGNIMSLLYGDNFKGAAFVIGTSSEFTRLFSGSSTVISAENLALPDHVDYYCYDGMFYSCPSFTTPPVLPATTLLEWCYVSMFLDCPNVNAVTTYAQDITPQDCITDWLGNVAATGDFYNEGGADYPTGASGIPSGWTEHPTKPNYFYVQDVSGYDNTLTITKSGTGVQSIEVFYSTDRANWTSMGITSSIAITAAIPANGKLYLKATADTWGSSNEYNTITASGNHSVGGNIMSLLYGDNFEGQTSFPAGSTYNFSNLFANSTNIIDAQDLILPATTLTNSCYRSMFDKCSSLATAPELPATTLAAHCYRSMFYGTALTTAPALPATTLYDSCYKYMFNSCTGLTATPALPTTALANSCYAFMFMNCTSLTAAPELPATTVYQYCYESMFNSCTGLTVAPALPATTLAGGCYKNMFNGCTNLNSVTTYATNIYASNCLSNWLSGVSATGNFYNLGGIAYPSGASGIPTGWTEHTSL